MVRLPIQVLMLIVLITTALSQSSHKWETLISVNSMRCHVLDSERISAQGVPHVDAVYISSAVLEGERVLIAFRGQGVLRAAYCQDVFCRSHTVITVDDTVGTPVAGSLGFTGAAWTSMAAARGGPTATIAYVVAGSELRMTQCTTADCSTSYRVSAIFTAQYGRQLLGSSVAVLGDGSPALLTHEQGHTQGKLVYVRCLSAQCNTREAPRVIEESARYPGTAMSPRSMTTDANGFAVFVFLSTDASSAGAPHHVDIVFCHSYACDESQRVRTALEEGPQRPSSVGLFMTLMIGIDNHPLLVYAGYHNARYHLRTVRCSDPAACHVFSHNVHCEPAADPCQRVAVSGEAVSATLRGPAAIIGYMDRSSSNASNAGLRALLCADAACTAGHPGLHRLDLRVGPHVTFTSCVSTRAVAPACVHLDLLDPSLPMWISTRADLLQVQVCEGQGRGYAGCNDLFEQCDATDGTAAIEGTCKCASLADGVPSIAGISPHGCCGSCGHHEGKMCDQQGRCVCRTGYLPGDDNGITLWSPHPNGRSLRCVPVCVGQGRQQLNCTHANERCDVPNKHAGPFGTCICASGSIPSSVGVAGGQECDSAGLCRCKSGFDPVDGVNYLASSSGFDLTCIVATGEPESPPTPPPTPIPFGTGAPTGPPSGTPPPSEETCCCISKDKTPGENCIQVPISICKGIYECQSPDTVNPTAAPTLPYPCCCISKLAPPNENCLPNIPQSLCTDPFKCIKQPDVLFTQPGSSSPTATPTLSPSVSPGISGGGIAALVIFILILCTIAAILILLYLRRRQERVIIPSIIGESAAGPAFGIDDGIESTARPATQYMPTPVSSAPVETSWLDSDSDNDVYNYM